MAGLMRSWTDLELYTSCNILATEPADRGGRAGRRRAVRAGLHLVGLRAEAVGDEDRAARAVVAVRHHQAGRREARPGPRRASGFPGTIVRYFSIYGPRQRPDMAYHRFIEAMLDRRADHGLSATASRRARTRTSTTRSAARSWRWSGARPAASTTSAAGSTISLNEAIALIAGHVGRRPDHRARAGPARRPAPHQRRYQPRTRTALGYDADGRAQEA